MLDEYTAGIVLQGTEIKSVRLGKINMSDAFCTFTKDGELVIRNMRISPYEQGNIYNHEPKRVRKLLLNKNELRKLGNKAKDDGVTIIPVQLHFNERNIAKLDIALAKGKKLYDKRDSLKEKQNKREMDRVKKDVPTA